MSRNFLQARGVFLYEYNIITLLSLIGLSFLCSSSNMLMLFLAIELQSLSFYLLASFQWNSEYSAEAGIKYFILGSFSSCLLLFGFSMIYLSTGTFSFEVLQKLIVQPCTLDTTFIGILFCFTTFLFKVGASPFHMWLCDVYEGSLTSVTLFFAAIPKLVLFYLLIKLSLVVFPSFDNFWKTFFLASGLLSITVGSMAALFQKKMKRLLAFSAISHTGFILLALCSGSYLSIKASMFYLIFYAVMTFAVFSIVLISISQTNFLKYLISWSYLSKRNFCLAITFALVFFSLAGIPPLTGFYSKLLVFLALLNEQQIFTMILMALISCIGCFYYIRVIKILFFCSKDVGPWVHSHNRALEFSLASSSLIVTFFLIRPDSNTKLQLMTNLLAKILTLCYDYELMVPHL
jgi:NADH-quinone oxidoreductase subunit N